VKPRGDSLDQDRAWGTWDDLFATTLIEGQECTNRKIDLVGLGYIGELVAIRAKAFGMQVHVYDPCADHVAVVPVLPIGIKKNRINHIHLC